MCKETIPVHGLDNARTAYEVEQYLLGVPNVEDVDADFLNDVVTIEYDESKVDHAHILDKIEHSGCKPSEQIDGILDEIKMRLAGVRP